MPDCRRGSGSAHLIPPPLQAHGVGLVVLAAGRLGLGLGLLLSLGRLLLLLPFLHGTPRGADAGPNGCALPSISRNGAPDRPKGRTLGRPAGRPALLGRWRGGALLWLRRVNARLALGPLVALELILL